MQCERFNSWNIDEITYLNIDRSDSTDSFARSDNKNSVLKDISKIQEFVSRSCQVPLAWGGNLKTEVDAGRAIEVFGADKVIFTSALDENPDAIAYTARRFGSQAVCAGIDFRLLNDEICIYVQSGIRRVETTFENWVKKALDFGAGEILLHSIDRDGIKNGYELSALQRAKRITKVPIILLGGAGNPEHLIEAAQAGASGVAASNMWHFSDNVSELIRDAFVRHGLPTRNP